MNNYDRVKKEVHAHCKQREIERKTRNRLPHGKYINHLTEKNDSLA